MTTYLNHQRDIARINQLVLKERLLAEAAILIDIYVKEPENQSILPFLRNILGRIADASVPV